MLYIFSFESLAFDKISMAQSLEGGWEFIRAFFTENLGYISVLSRYALGWRNPAGHCCFIVCTSLSFLISESYVPLKSCGTLFPIYFGVLFSQPCEP